MFEIAWPTAPPYMEMLFDVDAIPDLLRLPFMEVVMKRNQQRQQIVGKVNGHISH